MSSWSTEHMKSNGPLDTPSARWRSIASGAAVTLSAAAAAIAAIHDLLEVLS